MKIKNGTHRTVFIGKYLTIKIPRILNTLRIIKNLPHSHFRAIYFDFKQLVVRSFLEGSKENWNEFLCWRENKADFLVPVYFSIGMVEIQKTVHLEEISEDEINKIWASLVKLNREMVWEADHHTLANRLNYHKDAKKYKMVDYGGRGIRELVKRYRKELDEILSIKI